MERSRKRWSWSRLFGNKRFALVFSILLAFIIWTVLMYRNTDDTQNWRIDDVPITLEYTTGAVESGYKVYDTNKSAVSVSVTGNTLTVRQVKAENLEVVATITGSLQKGNNTVSLSARKKSGSMNDFTVASIDPGTIEVYVDVPKEKTLSIENGISASVAENYYMPTPQFANETVTVSGPETEVNRVVRAAAEYDFTAPLSETREFPAQVVLYDENGEPVESAYLSASLSSVDVRIQVLWQQSVPLQPTFVNRPALFANRYYTLTPDSVTLAGSKDSFNTLTSITLPPFDFSKLNLSTESYMIEIPALEGFTSISGEKRTTLRFNLNGYSEKWFTVTEIAIANKPADREVEIYDQSISVMVVGPTQDLESLEETAVSATLNLSNVETTGTTELPITVAVSGTNTCWVYGTYKAAVNIS